MIVAPNVGHALGCIHRLVGPALEPRACPLRLSTLAWLRERQDALGHSAAMDSIKNTHSVRLSFVLAVAASLLSVDDHPLPRHGLHRLLRRQTVKQLLPRSEATMVVFLVRANYYMQA